MRRAFIWSVAKARQNLAKHGVSFAEALSVFEDPLARIDDDPDHSAEERREIILGQSRNGRLLLVSFTERGVSVRIISARIPDRDERKRYEEENI
jgi:uncharacterized DUF497 family protein